MPACLIVFNITTAGVDAIGCAIAPAATAGYSGGVIGESAGESIGEVIYEWRP